MKIPAVKWVWIWVVATSLSGLQIMPAVADETSTHPATTYRVDGITEITEGPYKPGDVIAFGIKTALSRQNMHYFQITGECFTAPAEWHVGSEKKFLDGQYATQGYAVATISSGCIDGIHQINEVEIEDNEQGYARINYDGVNSIATFQVIGGQLRAGSDNSSRKGDSINAKTLPLSIRMKSTGPIQIWDLPRLTTQKQTISWAVNGKCLFKRGQGAGDNGGRLVALAPGKCNIAANTPWGSNLFNPVNKAWEIRIYSAKAILCVNKKSKKQFYLEKSMCPKGYAKK